MLQVCMLFLNTCVKSKYKVNELVLFWYQNNRDDLIKIEIQTVCSRIEKCYTLSAYIINDHVYVGVKIVQ